MSAREALARRRSWPRVTEAAPDEDQLAALVAVAARTADHAALAPWRLIQIRGRARDRVARALADAEGASAPSPKPLRAPLLIAIVASIRDHPSVPDWEQEIAAAGVAHALSLLLDEAGWGVMWRSGPWVRSDAVARAHDLQPGERLLGWLYVGGRPAAEKPGRPREVDLAAHLGSLAAIDPIDDGPVAHPGWGRPNGRPRPGKDDPVA